MLHILFTFVLNQDCTVKEVIGTMDMTTLFKPITSDEGNQQLSQLRHLRQLLYQQITSTQEVIDEIVWKPQIQGIFFLLKQPTLD